MAAVVHVDHRSANVILRDSSGALFSTIIDDRPYRFRERDCQICGRHIPWPLENCLRCRVSAFMETLPARHLAQKRPGLLFVLVHVFPFLDDNPELTPREIKRDFLLNVLLVRRSPFRRLWGHYRPMGILFIGINQPAEKAMRRILSFL